MKPRKNIVVYALSTCVWCKKTKRLLDNMGIDYKAIDVDLLTVREEEAATETINKWSSDGSFPVIVIDDEKAICGFDEEKIRKECA